MTPRPSHTDAGQPLAPPSAVLETCLYVADLARAREFYTGLFGYEVMTSDERFCAFNIGGKQVLLLFAHDGTALGSTLPFGDIPPHGTQGPTHIGFSVPAETLDGWRERLAARRIAIESTLSWPAGGTSIFFRDPDGHLLELLTPGVWPIY